MVDSFFSWPMPLVWAMLVGLPFLRRRVGRRLLALCVILLATSSLPIVGRSLYAPLSAGAVATVTDLDGGAAVAVIVPTAGSFVDAEGTWWPQGGTIRRFVAGRTVARYFDLPLYVAGGTPVPGQPPEAVTLVGLAASGDARVRTVPRGNNSVETAEALAALPELAGAAVVLVTDRYHVVRMRAALRRQGFRIVASVVPTVLADVPAGAGNGVRWRDFVPSGSGLDATGAAFREYVGIAWYLATGGIGAGDL